MSDDKTAELLPCPFCGGVPTYEPQVRGRGLGASVFCESCGASGGGYYNAADPASSNAHALAAWNRRPPTMPDREAKIADEMIKIANQLSCLDARSRGFADRILAAIQTG